MVHRHHHKKKPIQPPKLMLWAYWPLLRNPNFLPGTQMLLDKKEDIEAKLAEVLSDEVMNAGFCTGCIWTLPNGHDGLAEPVLVIEKAQAVADHLVEYAENKVSEWFKLYVFWEPGCPNEYSVAVMPVFKKALERWRAARMLFWDDVPLQKDSDVTIMFRPIRFVGRGQTFPLVHDRLPKVGAVMRVGLVDPAAVDMANSSVDDTAIRYFELERAPNDDGNKGYFAETLVHFRADNPAP